MTSESDHRRVESPTPASGGPVTPPAHPPLPDHEAGLRVRRAVLGDEHVDRAMDSVTDVNRDFQEFITTYAWGGIWDRPGLDRRSRSIGVLTALVAGRHFDELEFHLRAALRNGLTREEIVEVLLQTAVYVGVPAANSAFAVARRVLGAEDGVEDGAEDGVEDGTEQAPGTS